jgi:endoglucanase
VRPVPSVTVSYSVVQRWDGGLQGKFTIVNHSSTALAGWEIRAVFPGDQIESAWGSAYQASGDTLVLDPSFPVTVPAGAGQSMNFTAGGTTTSPATCTLNGAACS